MCASTQSIRDVDDGFSDPRQFVRTAGPVGPASQLAIEMYDEEGVSYTRGRGRVPVVKPNGRQTEAIFPGAVQDDEPIVAREVPEEAA